MFRDSAAASAPGSRAEHALLPGRVHAALPAPDAGWVAGAYGMLGWGEQDVIEAPTPREVGPALERLLGQVPDGGPWLGGWAFDLQHEPVEPWADFPLLRFFRPQVLLRWDEAGARLEWTPESAARARSVAGAWDAMPSEVSTPGTSWAPGARTEWDALHARAVEAISRGALEKVVLARSAGGTSTATPLQVLLALAQENPTSRAFLFRRGTRAFLGATPETLCRLKEDRLQTEALAGTAPLEDADGLSRSNKDLREHAHVVTAIRAALEGRVDGLVAPSGPEVLRLPRVAHLRTPISARLSHRAALPALVRELHPTPAVNGWPRDAASAFIQSEERLSRGWFTGVVGCVEGASVELRVALRCALLSEDGAVVAYAGAGVVAGSTSGGEWAETSRKLRTVQAALGGEGQPHV